MLGTLEVTTTWLVVFASIVGILLFAASGSGSTLEINLTHWPALWGFEGYGVKPWTIVTWPIAYPDFSFFDAFAIFIFWWFGTDLERDYFGRTKFAALLGWWTLSLGVLLVVVDQLNSSWGTETLYGMYGLGMLELMVVLLWIAEAPFRTFFFNIPAWVIGVLIVAIDVVTYIGHRQWDIMLTLVLGIVVCGFIARQYGALSDYAWIPRLNLKRRRRVKQFAPGSPTVVSGPWTPPVDRDEDRMNELLDKISAHGQDSLTERERAELIRLSAKRRQS